jgi:hypothetical protein
MGKDKAAKHEEHIDAKKAKSRKCVEKPEVEFEVLRSSDVVEQDEQCRDPAKASELRQVDFNLYW